MVDDIEWELTRAFCNRVLRWGFEKEWKHEYSSIGEWSTALREDQKVATQEKPERIFELNGRKESNGKKWFMKKNRTPELGH